MSQTLVSEDEDVIAAMERQMQSRAEAVYGSTDTAPRRTAGRTAADQARLQAIYDAAQDKPQLTLKQRLGRSVVWTVLFALIIAAFSGLFGATTASANDDEDELSDRSFYNLSSHLTEFFSSLQEPGSEDSWDNYARITGNAGTAGSFIGYLDVSFLDDPSNWAISNLSGSSSAMSYDTFEVKDEDGNVSTWGTGFQDYAHFGAALNDAGFDSTSTGLTLSVMNGVLGGLMLGAWVLSYVVDFTFWLFIQLLQVLNPFGWFYLGVQDALGTNAADGMTGGEGSPADAPIIGTALEGLVTWIGSWYSVLYDMAWQALVPIFLGVLIIGLLMFRSMDKGSAIKKFLIRVFFIVFGIPLLGSMYAGVLHTLSEDINPSATGSTQVVMSSFVDFEKWARDSRLNIPEEAVIEWDIEGNGVSDETLMNLRNTALAINAQSYPGLTVDIMDGGSAQDRNAEWAAAQMPNAEDEALSGAGFNDVMNMLLRFINADQVTAASFETEMKAWMSQNSHRLDDSVYRQDHDFLGDLDSDGVIALFDHVADPGAVNGGDAPNGIEGNAMYSVNPLVAVQEGTGLTDTTGGLTGGHNAGVSGVKTFESVDTRERCYAQAFSSSGEPLNCNLAPMAMFNYLNTSFDSTALTSYSSGNVMSEATRSIHNSVNTTGTGVMSFMIWMNSMTLLVSFILIGFGYAFAMLFGAIKRTFQIISAIPFGIVGVISGIAKIIIYTFALIIQTLVTIFIYMFVQQFLRSLPQIIEMPFASLIDWSDGGVLGFMSGTAITIITMLISIVGTIAFTVIAMRVRGSVVSALEEVITKIIERFTGSNVAAPGAPTGGGGPVQGALAGVGAGIGGAAANRMMTNRSGGGAGPGGGGAAVNAAGTNGPEGPGGAGGPAKLASAGAPAGAGAGPYGGKSADQLTAEEQNNISNGIYGSPNPNDPDYDPNHPMSPDAAAGDTEINTAQMAGGQHESAGLQPEGQMRSSTDDVREGERISNQGLAIDGNEHLRQGDQVTGDQVAGDQQHGDEHQGDQAQTVAAGEAASVDQDATHQGDVSNVQAGDEAVQQHDEARDMSRVEAGETAQVEGDEHTLQSDAETQREVATGEAADHHQGDQHIAAAQVDHDQDARQQLHGGDTVDAARAGDQTQIDNRHEHELDVDKDQSQTQLASGQRPVAGTEKSDLWNPEGAVGREVGNKVIDKTVKDPEKREKMKHQQQRIEGTTKSMKQGAAKGAAKGFVKGGPAGAATGAAKGAVTGVAKNERQHRKNVKADKKDVQRQGSKTAGQAPAPKPRQTQGSPQAPRSVQSGQTARPAQSVSGGNKAPAPAPRGQQTSTRRSAAPKTGQQAPSRRTAAGSTGNAPQRTAGRGRGPAASQQSGPAQNRQSSTPQRRKDRQQTQDNQQQRQARRNRRVKGDGGDNRSA